MIKRLIKNQLLKDLETKIVLLSGPRQSGKTTLSHDLFPSGRYQYLNFDTTEDRNIILKKAWDRSRDLVVFDELHKLPNWKSWIKGVYDKEGVRPRLLVTGSARLDLFKKAGDSLAGRHHFLRVGPFQYEEVADFSTSDDVFARFLNQGGFPEPFLMNDSIQVARWRKSHLDRILRDDLLSLQEVKNITQLEILVDLLADRVGSTLSYSSLAKVLEVAPKSVQRWVEVLEKFFIVFVVKPYSNKIDKSILKEPKIYFYDTGRVKNDESARFENSVALQMLLRLQFLEDTQGENNQLCYLKNKHQKEVDFLTVRNRKPEWMIETKVADQSLSSNLFLFKEQLPKNVQAYQLINRFCAQQNQRGIELMCAPDFFKKQSF
jgi:predicted AAA+ superfamily ATPase